MCYDNNILEGHAAFFFRMSQTIVSVILNSTNVSTRVAYFLEALSSRNVFNSIVSGANVALPCYGGPCHHSMAQPWIVDEECSLQIWRGSANILNKQ
jgi:hypothetical protein